MNEVANKYKFNRGTLQCLQQTSSTFAGIVKSFCNALNWNMLALIVAQFKDRIFFGVHQDLIEIMKIPILNGKQRIARILFNSGFQTLADISTASLFSIEKTLIDSISFDVEKRDGETNYEAEQRHKSRLLFAIGKNDLTIKEAAKLIIDEARYYLQNEIGLQHIVWTQKSNEHNENSSHENDERNGYETPSKKPSKSNLNAIDDEKCYLNNATSSAIKKRKLLNTSNTDMSSPKRNKSAPNELNETLSDTLSSNNSDVDLIDFNDSATIYNDEQDDEFLQQFEYHNKSNQKKIQKTEKPSIHLQIIEITESINKFNKFIETVKRMEECAFEIAVCRQTTQLDNKHLNCIISQDFFICGLAFCFRDEFTIYFLNLQNDQDSVIDFKKKIDFLHDLLLMKHLTLSIYQAKRQLKTLANAIPTINKIKCNIEDPEIAHWLLHPNMDNTLDKMVW